jgi:hypothetical protein
MNVNLNNLRKKACIAHDRLVKALNSNINEDGDITIPAEDLDSIMNDLRMTIGSIAFCHQPDDENFKDVYEELYPGEKTMADFNPQTEE